MNFVKRLVTKIFLAFMFILLILILPILVIIFLTFSLLRLFVSYLSVLRPDLSNLIESPSNCLAVDDMSNPKATVLMALVIKGDCDLEAGKNICRDIIEIKNDNGELRNKELKQYSYQWMGFLFWKWEDNFDLSDHVKYYELPDNNQNSKVSEIQLQEIYSNLLRKPYEEGKSPWEVLIIRNIDYNSEEEHSVVVFRWHHSLADGFSGAKLGFATMKSIYKDDRLKFEEIIPQPTNSSPKQNASTIRKFLAFFKIILTPFQLINKTILRSVDRNPWVIPSSKYKNEYIISSSEKIPLSLLKEVKNVHNVGLTTVIYAGMTGAMRKAMMKRDGKVPKNIPCSFILPMPGHPDKLTNHASGAIIKLPVGEQDPVKRLKYIDKNINMMKGNLAPILFFYLGSAIGGALFPWMINWMGNKQSMVTVGTTSFPGPKIQVANIIDVRVYLGPIAGRTAALLNSYTYGNGIRFSLSVNKAILHCQEEVDNVLKAIKEEFILLRGCEIC